MDYVDKFCLIKNMSILTIIGIISLIGNFLKYLIYALTFKKKRNIYKMRMFGLINAILGKQAWFRPEIN